VLRLTEATWFRRLVTGRLGRPLVARFVAGEHLDDAIRVAKKARADGIPVTLEIWPGMVHVFQIRGFPESREAIQRIGKFVKSTPGS